MPLKTRQHEHSHMCSHMRMLGYACTHTSMHARKHACTAHMRIQYLFSHSCMHARTHIYSHTRSHTYTSTYTQKTRKHPHSYTHTHTLRYASVDRILGQNVRKPSENRGTRVPQIQEVYLSASCKRASSLRPLISLHAHTLSFPLHPGPSPSNSVVF